MSEGIERAKKLCIDHTNIKRQSALIVACKHGHSDCVEYLVTNGSDPMICDERRHNTALHFAALYGHSDCIHKLLSSRISHGPQPQVTTSVALIPCPDEGNIRFIDRHNGWGLRSVSCWFFLVIIHEKRTSP
jgi:ankyrin repeat protein